MSPIDQLSKDLQKALEPFHPGIVTAAFFFGESVEPGFTPGKAHPVQAGLFLSEASADNLRRLIGLSRDFRRRNVHFPYVLTEEFIESSLDSFALEFIELRQFHRMILGASPFSHRTPDVRAVRLQTEHAIRTFGLHLKSALLQAHTDAELALMLEDSKAELARLFLGLLTIKGKAEGVRMADLMGRAAGLCGLDSALFTRLSQSQYPNSALLPFYESLLKEIEKLSGLVDTGRI